MCPKRGLETISKKFTCEILDKIISECGGVKHKSWRFGAGFRKEDSFISEVCRLIVIGVKEDQSEFVIRMIVKSMPENPSRRMSVRSVDFFRNEIQFYETVLKKLDNFQKARNIADGLMELPRCYASLSDGENDFIALEDLTSDGYETSDRASGLNFDQCKQIMPLLGKFHALSLAFRDQEPSEFEEIIGCVEETYYSEKCRTWYEPYQRAFIFATTDAITREYGGTVYETKMLEFTGSNFYDTMCRLAQTTNPFSVICHGDLWTPNFLFKHSNSDNTDIAVKIIDFQLARFASPVTDLSFFAYACTEQDTREQHFDELIQIYHQSVTSMLLALGSNASIFPYSALQHELKHYAKFGVGMAMGALSLCVTNDDEDGNPKVMEIDGDAVVPLDKILSIEPCKSKQGRLRMASTYKHAVDNGFFD